MVWRASFSGIMGLRQSNTRKEFQTMAHYNTVLHQVVKIFSRHEFESLAKRYHLGQAFRNFSRWGQFIALTFAQLSGRASLRDIELNLRALADKLYHLGVKGISRSTLARVNETQPYEFYQELCDRLLKRLLEKAPRHKFRFKNKLYTLDASVIDLCLSVFPWAAFRRAKGGIKLHVGLDHQGYLPVFLTVTEALAHEINWARKLKLTAGAFLVFDRGFTDYHWYQELCRQGIFFVTRLKDNARYQVIASRKGPKGSGALKDQTIYLRQDKCSSKLRLVTYQDPESGKIYRFLTNAFHLSASTVAAVYKERWQIELFFKWIKQNLKIKSFLGTSKNAVLTQLWIAVCVYLMLAYLKFKSKLEFSLQQILRLLHTNLFQRRNLLELLQGKPPANPLQLNANQLVLI